MSGTTLPVLFGRWMSEALGREAPAEVRANCSACTQVCGTPDVPAALATFDPETKCCTYLPLLRAFQVGAVLLDPEVHPDGRASVLRRIADGVGVTPLGLLWPASFADAYGEGDATRFGRLRELRCPHHLDGGLCGIWRHRNSTCSTWFCRYERGQVGRAWWRSLQAALEQAEDALMWWCVDQLDVGAAARELLASGDGPRGRLDGSEPITPGLCAAVWGRWAGRELAFYEEAARIVQGLSWPQVLVIGGGRLQALIDDLRMSTEDLDNVRLPAFVGQGRWLERVEADGATWVHGYRAYDPVRLEPGVVRVLDGMEVMPVDEARWRLSAATTLDETMLRSWIDLGVLQAGLPRR